MSEYKLISPLLDGFAMGDPMSSHNGVRCCPAMRENSDEKYIVKIISIPASQRQMDALLLSGAYPDAASATAYFKELADGIVGEAELLNKLSKLEGFLPYDNWQVAPMEDNKLGYDVYLVNPYRRSLDKFLRRNTMTHLGAVNLGLDLCAALSLCRRAGFVYVAMKPGNVFLTGEREFRIGDLGFANLKSLKYTAMPARHRSCFTPPELHDALATLNPTVDIYGVGMILYLIYNNGVLPFDEKAPNKILPAPANADYEMAEIIAKACHPNPRYRYQTPIEMGQALAEYMQRNTVNDVPIVPPVAEPVTSPTVSTDTDELPPLSEEVPVSEPEQDPVGEPASEALDFLQDLATDETVPGTDETDAQMDIEMSDEVSEILAHADALVADAPAEPEQPNSDTDAPPAPADEPEIDTEELELKALLADAPEEEAPKPSLPTPSDEEDDDDGADESDFFAATAPKKKTGRWIGIVVLILILALLGGGGFYFYQNYYLLPIEAMKIDCNEDTITVFVTTEVDPSILTVVCTDSYGNKKTSALQNGQAVFTELNPDTQYKFTVEAEGFHQLSGSYYGTFATGKQTNILDFTAKTGTEDGSVVLNFTVDGPETQDWVMTCSTEGEEARSVSFTGHMVTISGLTVGKNYTFTLTPPPGTEQWIVGTNTLEFTASKIVMAENVNIVSCVDGVLTAQWSVAENAAVDGWTVRCYSDAGYDQTVTVTENTVTFSGIDTAAAYTVEVWASGMTQSTRAYISANPITVTDIQVADSGSKGLNVTWNFSGTAPEGGWLLMYTMDGNESQEVITCANASATIPVRIPKVVYDLTIKAANGSTVFGGVEQFTCPAASNFEGYGLKAEQITAHLLLTPEKENWTYKDVEQSDYTSDFSVNAKASIVMETSATMIYPYTDTEFFFVIRNAEGKVVPQLVSSYTKGWSSVWKNRHGVLDIPAMPTTTGNYTLEVYFGGALALSQDFKVTAG